MSKTFSLEVGQSVFIEVANKYRPELPAKKMLDGTVAKIGRQYFYVNYNPRLAPIRFRKDTFKSAPMQDNPYDEVYRIYETEKEFKDEMLARQYRSAIISCNNYGDMSRLSLEGAKAIYEILVRENGENVKKVEEKNCEV